MTLIRLFISCYNLFWLLAITALPSAYILLRQLAILIIQNNFQYIPSVFVATYQYFVTTLPSLSGARKLGFSSFFPSLYGFPVPSFLRHICLNWSIIMPDSVAIKRYWHGLTQGVTQKLGRWDLLLECGRDNLRKPAPPVYTLPCQVW